MQDDLNLENITPLEGGIMGKERGIAGFVSYWQQMRKGGDVPRRSDIDPRGIEALLENAFIAEKIAPGMARLRIAGTHLTDLMGMEVRGMPISAFITPDHRQQLADLLVELFDRPATLKISLASAGSIGRPALNGTLVMLPLRSDMGDVSRALGCLVTTGPMGRAPRRFDIQSHDLTPLTLPYMGAPMASAAAPVVPGLAESAPGFRHAPAAHSSERPYLRLVKSE